MARLGFVDQEGNVSHISSSTSYTPTKKKKKKDEDITTIKTNNETQDIRTVKTEDTKKPNLIDKAKVVAEGGISGLASGLTGVADTPMQGAREQLQKGEKNKTKGDMLKDAAVGIMRASSPVLNAILKNKETSEAIKKTFKDKDKNTLQKVVNSGLVGVGNSGIDNTYEGINTALRGAGALNNNLDEQVANLQAKIDKPSQDYQQKVSQRAQEIGGLTNTLTNVSQQIGNMGPSIAATAITKNPSAGLALMGVSAKGQSTNEALQNGADLETANRIGTAKGLTEVGTELMTGGAKIFGKGTLDDIATNFIDKKIGKAGLNWIAKQGLGVVGEIGEEIASDLIGTLIDRGTIDPNANYSPQDLLNTIKSTSLTTLALNGLTGGYTPKAYRQNAIELQESRGNNGNISNNNDNVVPNSNQVREVNEIQQKAQNGEITYEQANQQLEQVQNGTYQQNQNLEAIASQEVQRIQQAVETGQMDPSEATQEIQAITNTLQSERERINTPQQEVQQEVQEETQQEAQETKEEPIQEKKSPTDLLNEKEKQKLQSIYKKQASGEVLSKEDKATLDKFRNRQKSNQEIEQRKEQGLKNPELTKPKTYQDVRKDYGKYYSNADMENFDTKIANKAAETIAKGRYGRTKQQWYDLAKNIGMQAENMDSESLKKYAFASYKYFDPNAKGNINKQSNKKNYTQIHEWVNAVYEGARVGEKATQTETKQTKTEKQIENFKERGTRVLDKVPEGYIKVEGATTAPNGYTWYSNGKSMFKGERESVLVKDNVEAQEQAPQKTTQEPTKENNAIVKSNGQVITAPIETKGKNKLANIEINVNDGGNGNNGGNNNVNTKQGNNNIGDDAQILENYKDRKANKKASLREQASELMHSAVRAIFDRGEIIDRIGKAHNDNQLYSLYDMTFTSDSTADFNIGGMKESYQSNLSGEKIGESLENCWKPVEDAGLVRDMNKYLYELHNIDRWQQLNEDGSRKYVFSEEHSDAVSRENIKELLEIHPELEKLSKPILQYQKNLLNILVESGEVSQATADYLNKTYKNYVPTWRDVESINNSSLTNDKGNLTIDNQIKTAKGSNLDLLPLKEVQAQMTKNIFKSAKMNVFGQQLYKDIGDLNKLKEIGMKGLKEQYLNDNNFDETNKKAFLKAGEQYLEEYLKDFAPNNIPVEIDKGQKTMTVYFNGEKVKMPINNEIVTALKATKPNNKLAKTLSKINDFKRGVITQYSPGFSISNALKDAPDAVLNSKYGKEYPAEYARTVKEMLGRGLAGKDLELFNQYCALGGMSNTIFDSSEGFKTDSTAKKIVGFLPNTISEVNDIIEQIPRFTEFKLTLKNGGTLSEAMYNAAEVTTNFKRGGTVTKALDAYGTTFLNASTSGFYKQIRNIIEQPNGVGFLKFAGKAMALGLTPAIINSLIYASPFGDEEEKKEAKEAYESLRQFEKDDYLLWYTGDGKFLKIPKGRAVSIPAIVYNAALNKAKGKNVSLKEVLTSIMNQTGPNNPLTDNAILSLAQTKLFDKESQGTSWSGSPIESSYMQTLRPGERYDSKTDEFSKWLGGKLNVSPKKINYLLQQNTGILGDMVLPYITSKSTGESLASRGTNFLTRRFRTDTVTSNNTTEEFYNNVTKYSQNAKSSNPKYATEKNKIRNAYLNNKSSEIAELRKEIEEINSDKTISKDEKYKQTRELYKQINKIAKDANKSYKEVKKQGDYAAIIGGNVYVENDYGKWKKESEQTKEKRDSLGLNAEDYYYYKKDEAFTKPDGKQTTLVDGDKAKEKIALVDAFGFDPSDYLEYSYNINQIKEGKNTKSKVFEYINGLNITQEQKIMLMKKKYKTYRNYDNQLFNTINNSDLTLEEKESLKNFLKIGE